MGRPNERELKEYAQQEHEQFLLELEAYTDKFHEHFDGKKWTQHQFFTGLNNWMKPKIILSSSRTYKEQWSYFVGRIPWSDILHANIFAIILGIGFGAYEAHDKWSLTFMQAWSWIWIPVVGINMVIFVILFATFNNFSRTKRIETIERKVDFDQL